MNEQLKQFLIKANKAGYASADISREKSEQDISTTIRFEEGNWRMNDNYFGGEPYGGRQVIFYNNLPYWIMVYYGWVEENVDANKVVYPFLQSALKALPEGMPLRGPEEFIEGDLKYINSWSGTLERYKGEEVIYYQNKEVYRATYMGGLVDQRK